MSQFPQDATVVLAHGAWADSSCWANTILPLKQQGLEVICAPLPLTSLTNDINALNEVVERTSGPVILAGHAYGGAPIAGVTAARVRALVYIAALAPDEKQTVADVFYRDEQHPEAPKLVPDRHGLIWMTGQGFQRAVAHKASDGQTSIMASVQRPISVACIQEPAPAPAWKTKPSWFLLAEEDRMINPKTQEFMASRMKANILRLPVDHTPIATAPDRVFELLKTALAASSL
jgi:pimeloyl-ACP methyl ester carboxylesterase